MRDKFRGSLLRIAELRRIGGRYRRAGRRSKVTQAELEEQAAIDAFDAWVDATADAVTGTIPWEIVRQRLIADGVLDGEPDVAERLAAGPTFVQWADGEAMQRAWDAIVVLAGDVDDYDFLDWWHSLDDDR